MVKIWSNKFLIIFSYITEGKDRRKQLSNDACFWKIEERRKGFLKAFQTQRQRRIWGEATETPGLLAGKGPFQSPSSLSHYRVFHYCCFMWLPLHPQEVLRLCKAVGFARSVCIFSGVGNLRTKKKLNTEHPEELWVELWASFHHLQEKQRSTCRKAKERRRGEKSGEIE